LPEEVLEGVQDGKQLILAQLVVASDKVVTF
jgi:hypothetical protein